MTNEEMKRIIARNIKYQLDRNGMRQIDLARKLGTGGSTVHDWLVCKTTPRAATLKQMTSILDCKMSDFYIGITDENSASAEAETLNISPDTMKQFQEILSQLTPDNQSKLLELAHLYLSSQPPKK